MEYYTFFLFAEEEGHVKRISKAEFRKLFPVLRPKDNYFEIVDKETNTHIIIKGEFEGKFKGHYMKIRLEKIPMWINESDIRFGILENELGTFYFVSFLCTTEDDEDRYLWTLKNSILKYGEIIGFSGIKAFAEILQKYFEEIYDVELPFEFEYTFT